MELAQTPESLSSEDWISQPRSSAPASIGGDSSLLHKLSSTSQSRIPRLASWSTSVSNHGGKGSAETIFSLPDTRRTPALNERTASELNTFRMQAYLNQPKALPPRRHYSSCHSIESLEPGTVQYVCLNDIAKKKSHRIQTTPDWRQDVLGGVDHGRRQDLFSPMGLEHVFKPPTPRQKSLDSSKRKGKKHLEQDGSLFPSSPPIRSQEFPKAVTAGGPNTTQNSKLSISVMNPLLPCVVATSKPYDGTAQDYRGSLKASSQMIQFIQDKAGSTGSELCHEIISPVQVIVGHVKCHQSDEKINRNQEQESKVGPRDGRPLSRSSDNQVDYRNLGFESPLQTELAADWTSLSLPDNLSVCSDLFANKDRFVSIRRGGYSMDDSIQKRSLSPSCSQPQEAVTELACRLTPTAETSKQTQLASIKKPFNSKLENPIMEPKTPSKPVAERQIQVDQPRSSGSPLKLFDTYDTFTNDRLVRRMSQFEESIDKSSNSIVSKAEAHEESPSLGKHNQNDLEQPDARSSKQHKIRVTNFGDDNLDTCNSVLGEIIDGGRASHSCLSKDFQDRFLRSSREEFPQGCCHEDFTDTMKFGQSSVHDKNVALESLSEVLPNDEGKRLPSSPIRHPNPKRRRTVHSSIEVPATSRARNPISRAPPNSIVGRKRKDARYDECDQVADPRLIATRQMLHPRTPTLSQTRVNVDSALSKTYVREGSSQTSMRLVSLGRVDASTQALAGELAHFALDVAQDITRGGRKTSVKTTDFTNAANLIMQNIRAQASTQYKFPGGSDSAGEGLGSIEESVETDSTMEEFSRPPSREGGVLRLLRAPKQLDPRVLSHLRKFEEHEELGLNLSSSMKSLKIKENCHTQGPDISESDTPNIRISKTSQKVKEIHQQQFSIHEDFLLTNNRRGSESSRGSSGQPMGLSIPTQSSSASGLKTIIAPQSVSHLISDNVAGMTFDHSRRVWVRRKVSNTSANPERIHSDKTEEDPLKGIPDLSVDEIDEMKRIKSANTSSYPSSRGSTMAVAIQDLALLVSVCPDQPRESCYSQCNGPRNTSDAKSATDSRQSKIPSCGAKIGTRATSRGDIMLLSSHGSSISCSHASYCNTEKANSPEQVEHEISILEGREHRSVPRPDYKYRQPRVVTVAFSSPLVNQNDGSYSSGKGESEDEQDISQHIAGYSKHYGLEKLSKASRRASLGTTPKTKSRMRRTISIPNHSYSVRQISRIDEQDEQSFLGVSGGTGYEGMELAISTPQETAELRNNLAVLPPTIGRTSDYTFHLTPLSDFTIHGNDEPTNTGASRLSREQGLLSSHVVEDRFSFAIKDLVQKITDVMPYEPYWESTRQLDLAHKGLLTIFMLEEFCSKIEELDISWNELAHLNGAPESVRVLNVCQNRLSNLTPWGHLHNLQYLNVSGNKLQSLHVFQGLIHLREIQVDDNEIEDIDGIASLSGLIKLRAKRNAIKTVNFGGSDLPRLLILDLEGNQISSVAGLQLLPAITNLNLKYNRLTRLTTDPQALVRTLKVLDISNNLITHVDLKLFPNLRSVVLDNNSISEIQSIGDLRSLEIMSWRKQTLTNDERIYPFTVGSCCEFRKLYLSSNRLSTFTPTFPSFGLQSLELASIGIENLPIHFGLNMPSLRFLNLNDNALKDIRPLLGTSKLVELHLAGNRITRLRRTVTVLRKLGNALECLDCRANPLTLGFYAPIGLPEIEKQMILTDGQSSVENEGQDEGCSSSAAYLYPQAVLDHDVQYQERLDKTTMLRRRVYELLILSGCSMVKTFDGLPVDRSALRQQDEIWERLIDLGIVKQKFQGSCEDCV